MAELFKNNFNEIVIASMADNFINVWPEFDAESFKSESFANFDNLELKERSAQITQMMKKYLPDNFDVAGQIILDSLPKSEHEIDKNHLQVHQ